jgi:hypothetical protein
VDAEGWALRAGDIGMNSMGMNRGKRRMSGMILAVVIAAFGFSGCDDSSSPAGPEMEMQIQDQAVLAAMEEAIQDEYKAELIYMKVLDNFGSVRPFANIINAEVRHSEALARLFQARGLPVPESQWSDEEIPGFSSLTAACQAGVTAEIENAEIYEKYFSLDLPGDVQMVFENNRRASLENHLPAFQRCS